MNLEDENDFVALLTEHQSMIRAYVISLLPGSPGVDDVIQNTNRSIWINRNNFQIGTNFKAWAFTMARYQVMAYRKTLQRQKYVSLDDDVLAILAHECAESVDDTHEIQDALKGCLEKLNSKDRKLILHRYWSKTTLRDYAITTKVSVGSLKTKLFRIRESLKQCITHKMSADVSR